MKKWILALILLLVALPAFAAEKTIIFAWTQDVGTDFGGWKLYRATAPNVQPITANHVATVTYGGVQQTEYQSTQPMTVPDGSENTYYFVLTAYDTSGNESLPSNEISTRIDFLAPGMPMQFRIRITGQ